MAGTGDVPDTSEQAKVDRDRRDFLRKSAYAAYATPLITALLVETASAGSSKPADFCRKHPNHWKCR